MGILRVVLALAVVLDHLRNPWGVPIVPSNIAVQLFFIISGFYMGVILNEKYVGPGSYRLFIGNRFLRLYPVYYGVLGFTLVFCLLTWALAGQPLRLAPWREYWASSDGVGLAGLIACQLTIIGQDVVMFVGRLSDGSFHFTANFALSDPPAYKFLLVPQAWALAVEFSFYLLAPFIVRRSLWFMALLVGLSFGCRWFVFEGCGWHYDPWTYRFFPAELGNFLLGSCGYRFYRSYPRLTAHRWPAIAAWLLLLVATLTFRRWPDLIVSGYSIRTVVYLGGAAALLPLVYAGTGKWRLDRQIGEHSYPLYLVHLAVWWVIAFFLGRDPLATVSTTLGFLVMVVSFAMAALLVFVVMRPIDRIRERRVHHQSDGLSGQRP